LVAQTYCQEQGREGIAHEKFNQESRNLNFIAYKDALTCARVGGSGSGCGTGLKRKRKWRWDERGA